MKIMVIGGAGYIGSVTNRELIKAGFDTVIFDSMEYGHDWAVGSTKLIKGNLVNLPDIQSALQAEKPDAVIHFASYIQMGESYRDPAKYYRNNITGALNLCQALTETGINKIVFSSSAGVYGTPDSVPIKEEAPKNPENPYGQNKLDIEHMLHWFDLAHGLKSIALRYFNAAGALPDSTLGEAHQPESHIIPIFIDRLLKNEPLTINGRDYKTPDGTCVRDYVHVLDLASAHIKAVKALTDGASSAAYNVGTGHGYSNLEIAQNLFEVAGKSVPVNYGDRRPGDADSLVADSTKLQTELDWKPEYSDLPTILKTALAWHQKRRS